ncbi:hypothetical protein PARPLA_02844 [Rhodobacteraceae bacterium THAF1]|uniref:YceI family protein n=1 Tax=Palleronia sp. THAF1 TaxID=2587842 RepID=UPI000F41F25A|nr:YceI family protein [Palleronia sp. THAF1]QFU08246.1 hypothetical protein FIU81_06130 [Palleronia sp. THAF1]VDC28802.1 hypothetical protein PARPLA_02844 [Rhodobacteraceae bacterium THAF1]
MTRFLTATALTLSLGTVATAEPMPYTIDPAHSELVASWTHGGFSTTRAVVFDITGDVMYDEADPANSSVSVEIPTTAIMVTPEFTDHLMSADFFEAEANPTVTFESTSIEVTGDTTAQITGDFTANGITNPVTLDAELVKSGEGPQGGTIVGFAATTTILRSDYDMGMFAPFVSDEVEVVLNIETSPAE